MRKLLTFLIALSASVVAVVSPVSAQLAGGLMFPGPGTPAASGGGGTALTFGAMSPSFNTSTATVDYGTTNYTSGATRIIIAVQWVPNSGNTITAVNIVSSGVTFSPIPSAYANATSISTDMWISSGPVSGSSGDVQVTYTGHCAWESSIATYGLTTTTPAPGTAGTGSAINNTSATASIIIPTGGVALVVAGSGNGHTATFTNTLTPDADDTGNGLNSYYMRANTTGSISVVGTWSGNDNIVISAVPWGP
jgi:hypothetical protein